MTHTEQLEKEITEAKQALETCNHQIDGILHDLKIAITTGAAEHDIDELQVSKDALARKRERLALHLQALQERLPKAQREDAKERLPILTKTLQKQAKNLSEAYSNLAVVVETLSKAVDNIEATQQQCSEWSHIQEEVDFLCETHGIEKPVVPTLPQYPHTELTTRHWAKLGKIPELQRRLEEGAARWEPRWTKAIFRKRALLPAA